jgi:hypothetical protein
MAGAVRAGSLEPPSGAFDASANAPAATLTTLDEIYRRVEQAVRMQETSAPAAVARTGQTQEVRAGDDGSLRSGVIWPTPRLTDNGNGTVTDNLTRLIWDKNAGRGWLLWEDAVSLCRSLSHNGQDLNDGSRSGDWRLPNVNEFQSLVDYSQFGPCLPKGHPFVGVQNKYWTSTTHARWPSNAWFIHLGLGETDNEDRFSVQRGAWCVRGGH